ncbi:MAG: hypothetical protein J1E83_00490 [Lachnospiraceae bacterium]|nr:hypothetical protein [Lachnospiraceae bacterium]
MKTKIVCMGDSITEGFNITSKEAYPGQLQELLGEDYIVVNKGVCSSCTLNVELNGEVMGYPYVRQDRYREALLEKGDIYIIMLGTNDAQDGMDDVEDIRYPLHNMIGRKADFVSCYQSIIDSVREASPEAVIYLNIPMPIGKCIWRKHKERYLQELMPCYEEILKENPDIRKIDVHGAFEKLSEEEKGELYLEDGLHPNPRGAHLIARTVYEALQEEKVRKV